MTGSSVVRHTGANLLAKTVSLAIALFLTPFVLGRLTAGEFGLWMLAASITGFTALLDFGMGGAVAKYTAQYAATGDMEAMREMITAALVFYSAMALVAVLVSVGAAAVATNLIQVPAGQLETAVWAFLIIGTGVSLSLPASLPYAVLQGVQRFDILAALTIATSLVSAAGIWVALAGGFGLLPVLAVNAAVPLLFQAASVVVVLRLLPRFRLSRPRLSEMRRILSFSRWTLLLQFSNRMQTRSDEVVIATLLSLGLVAPYAVARRLGELVEILTAQFVRVVGPLASQFQQRDDPSSLARLYVSATRVNLAISTPFALTICLLSSQLLEVWVGERYAAYWPLAVLLTIATYLDTSQWAGVAVLEGLARHRYCAAMWTADAALNVFLSVLLAPRFGLVGIAIGTLLPHIVIHLGFVMRHALTVLKVNRAEIVRGIVVPTAIPAAATACVLIVGRAVFDPATAIAVLGLAAIGILVYVVAYVALGADGYERNAYRHVASSAVDVVTRRLKEAWTF